MDAEERRREEAFSRSRCLSFFLAVGCFVRSYSFAVNQRRYYEVYALYGITRVVKQKLKWRSQEIFPSQGTVKRLLNARIQEKGAFLIFFL